MPWKTLLLLLLCLLLCGCGKQDPTQEALDFRTALLETGGCSFCAQVSAEDGEQVYIFTLHCIWEDGSAQLEVLEPESIAGIRATVEVGSTKLEFDGATLDFGSLAGGQLSPVAAPWLLACCWQSEYIAWSGADGQQRRVTYLRGYEDEELAVDTWFFDRIPVYAEMSWNGRRCLCVTIREFQMK